VVSAGIYGFMKRRTTMAHVGTFAKTFFIMSPMIAAGVTNMEWSSRRFEEERYGYITDKTAHLRDRPLSPLERFRLYCGENKLKIMFGGWASSLGVALWLTNRDKYLTRSQKLVQARVWAQGFTILLLIGAAFVSTQSPGEERAEATARSEHNWEEIVAREEARLNALAAAKKEHPNKITTVA
jgi:hypothetical protein